MTSLVIQPPARLKSMAAIALLLWCAAAPVALAADPATLTVTFEGLKTHSGAVLLSL